MGIDEEDVEDRGSKKADEEEEDDDEDDDEVDDEVDDEDTEGKVAAETSEEDDEAERGGSASPDARGYNDCVLTSALAHLSWCLVVG